VIIRRALNQYTLTGIESISVDGQPLELERWYVVATSDYLQRGSGYRTLARNRNEKYRAEFRRDVLESYLRKESFVKSAFANRFVVGNAKSRKPAA